MFDKAIKFEHEYPPRWDGPIHPEDFSHIFATDYIELYKAKEAEYKTPTTKRVYCQHMLVNCNSECRAVTEPCGVFLGVRQRAIKSSGPNRILITTRCSGCNNMTCMVCDESAADCASMFMHKCVGKSRSNEERAHAFAGLKRGKDWQQCPNRDCRRPIELSEACNHMECPCGTGFCFICGNNVDGGNDHWQRGGCPRYNQPGDDDAEYDDDSDYGEDIIGISDPLEDIGGLFDEGETAPAELVTETAPDITTVQHTDVEPGINLGLDNLPSQWEWPSPVEDVTTEPSPDASQRSSSQDVHAQELNLSKDDADVIAMILQTDEEPPMVSEDGASDALRVQELMTTDELEFDRVLWVFHRDSGEFRMSGVGE